MKRARQQSGFTLIELVAVLILVGVLVGVGSLGLLDVVKGFNLAKDQTELAQTAQAAYMRMLHEFSHVPSGDATNVGSTTSFTYTAEFPGGSETATISYNSGSQTLDYASGATNAVLADNITAFTFGYLNTFNGTVLSSLSTSTKIIQITMTVSDDDGNSHTFSSRVPLL